MTPNPPLSTKAIWLLCAVVAGLAVSRGNTTTTTPVVLRLGLVYGRGILLARRRLLCVWRDPTRYQLLSTADNLRAVEAAIVKPGVRGIYHVGDDEPVRIQHFLDAACRVWRCHRPVRVPFAAIYGAAWLCESFAAIAHTGSPLTRDFVRLGRVSHWGDTRGSSGAGSGVDVSDS
jgi:hypothetical protein